MSSRWRSVRALAAAFRLAARSHRGSFAGMLAVALVGGLVPVGSAWLLRALIDELASGRVLAGPGIRHLLTLVLALGLTGALAAVLPNISQYLSAQSGRAVALRTVTEIFGAVTRLAGLRRIEDPAFQDELRFAQQAGSSGPGQVVSGTVAIAQSALTLSGFLVTLVVLSPVLTVVVAASVVPAILLQRGTARRQAAILRGITHSQRRQSFYADLLSSLPAAKEIRLFGLGDFFRGRMIGELRATQRESQRGDRRVLIVGSVLALAGSVLSAGGLVWAVLAAAAGRLTVGDVPLLVVALGSVSNALTIIIATGARTYQSLLMFGAYRDVLAMPADLPVPANPAPAGPLAHGIELRDVWFRYGPDKPWVLREISCFIPSGQVVALVGYNGAGKSTLIKLLCRFYDPERGRILWDGVDLRDLDPADLRDRITAVFGDFMAYELTAADNIAVGDLRRAEHAGELTAAARQARIHDELQALPKGYQTVLTRMFFDVADKANPDTGVLLSGGQWQRLALARAFLRGGRDLMLLDEPSAGLDAQAEHEIHLRLRETRQERTTVLISHRLNTVRDADHIVVLDDGLITEQGNHETLMARSGVYARLFSLQARGFTDSVSDVSVSDFSVSDFSTA